MQCTICTYPQSHGFVAVFGLGRRLTCLLICITCTLGNDERGLPAGKKGPPFLQHCMTLLETVWPFLHICMSFLSSWQWLEWVGHSTKRVSHYYVVRVMSKISTKWLLFSYLAADQASFLLTEVNWIRGQFLSPLLFSKVGHCWEERSRSLFTLALSLSRSIWLCDVPCSPLLLLLQSHVVPRIPKVPLFALVKSHNGLTSSGTWRHY